MATSSATSDVRATGTMVWWETDIAYHTTIRADPGRGPTAGPPIVVWSTEELVPALTAVAATRAAGGGWGSNDLIIVPEALATQVFGAQTQAVAEVVDPTATAKAQIGFYRGESDDPAVRATTSAIRSSILTAYPDEGGIDSTLDGANSANQARMQETLVAEGLVWTPTPYPFPVATVYYDARHEQKTYRKGKVLVYTDAATLAQLDDLFNRYLRIVTFTDGPPAEDLDAALSDLLLPADPNADFPALCSRDVLVSTYDTMRDRGYYVRVHLPDQPITFIPPASETEWRDTVIANRAGDLIVQRAIQAETHFPADIVSAQSGEVVQPITIASNLDANWMVEFSYDRTGQRWWLRNDPGSPLCTAYGNALTYAAAFWFLAPDLP